MNTPNTIKTMDTIIDRTMVTIEENLSQLIGDMSLMNALKFVDTMMDLRDRQHTYVQATQNRTNDCVKKPKRNETNGL